MVTTQKTHAKPWIVLLALLLVLAGILTATLAMPPGLLPEANFEAETLGLKTTQASP